MHFYIISPVFLCTQYNVSKLYTRPVPKSDGTNKLQMQLGVTKRTDVTGWPRVTVASWHRRSPSSFTAKTCRTSTVQQCTSMQTWPDCMAFTV